MCVALSILCSWSSYQGCLENEVIQASLLPVVNDLDPLRSGFFSCGAFTVCSGVVLPSSHCLWKQAQDTGIRVPIFWLLLLLRWWTLHLTPESFVFTWALMMPCRLTCWLASRVDLRPLMSWRPYLLLFICAVASQWHILVLYRCHSSQNFQFK